MTKKQHKDIARMWVAAFASSSAMDSFDSSIAYEDVAAIVEEAQELANKILGNRPLLNSLPEIIEYVLKNK